MKIQNSARAFRLFNTLMNFFLFCAISISVMLIAAPAFAQDDLPPLYRDLFSAETLTAILGIVGAVKLVRNPLNLKGFAAVAVTIVVSLVYGFLQYGLAPDGAIKGLVLGALAAGSFYLTKNFGKLLAAAKVGNEAGLGNLFNKAAHAVYEHPEIIKKIIAALKFIFFRK